MVGKTTHADGFEKGQEDGYKEKEFDPYVAGYMEGFRIGMSMAQRLVRIGEQARLDALVEEDRARRRERIYRDETGSHK